MTHCSANEQCGNVFSASPACRCRRCDPPCRPRFALGNDCEPTTRWAESPQHEIIREISIIPEGGKWRGWGGKGGGGGGGGGRLLGARGVRTLCDTRCYARGEEGNWEPNTG